MIVLVRIIGTIQLHDKYCEEHSRSEIQDNPAQINYIAGILDCSTTYTIMLRVGRVGRVGRLSW